MKKQSTYAKKSLVIVLCLMLGVGTAQVAFANEDTEFISEDSVVVTEPTDQKQEETTEVVEENETTEGEDSEESEQVVEVEKKEIVETVEETTSDETKTEETVEGSTDVEEVEKTEETVKEATKDDAKKVKAVKYNLGAIKNKTELEAAFAGALEGDVITLATDFVAEDITLKAPNANIVFDANNVTLKNSTLEIVTENNKTITIKNLIMDGSGHTGNLLRINNQVGIVNLTNATFTNNDGTPIHADIKAGTDFNIDGVLISNNLGRVGGSAIQIAENSGGTINITNSTISNNTGKTGGYSSGAIGSKFFYGNISIENTVFSGNHNDSVNTGVFGGGGGAIAFHYFRGNMTIKQSYFKGNKAGGDGHSETYDGGAIYIFDGRDGATVDIDQTTFAYNEAKDDGGAILFQGTGNPGLTTNIHNSTFYGNKAGGTDGANLPGGAIMYFKNGGSSKMTNTLSGSTFVDNIAGNADSTIDYRGGAISLSGAGLFATAPIDYKGTLFLGNKVYVNGVIEPKAKYKDVSNTLSTSNLKGNILNVDQTTVELAAQAKKDIFGYKNVGLSRDQSELVAGIEGEIIPTIAIKPEGPADDAFRGGNTDGYDQRGKKRLADIGAVEILWINYDANGGSFNLEEMNDYEGETYYEKDTSSKVVSYYDVTFADSIKEEQAEDSIRPERAGYKFMGWSKDKDATTPDSDFNTRKPVKVEDDSLRLYAVWRASDAFTVTYHGNGNTDGIEPADTNTYETNEQATVLDQSSLVKDGWIFVGWNTLANGTGTGYAKDANITMTQNVDLYAQWEEDVPPVTEKFTVTYKGNENTSGTAPIDTKEYEKGNTATILGAGDLIKDGYEFVGWNTQANGKGDTVSGTMTVNEDVTLYAQWKKLIVVVDTYTVVYDGNGNTSGNAPIDSHPYEKGEKIIVMGSYNLVKEGFDFIGWNTQTDGKGKNYAPGDSIEVTGDVSLFAQWNKTAKPVDPTKPGENNQTDLPQTGVSESNVAVIASLTLIGLGLVLVKKRKQEEA